MLNNSYFKYFSLALLIMCFALVVMSCEEAESKEERVLTGRDPALLRIGVIPSPSREIILERHQPFKAYLEEVLDRRVEIVISSDYNSQVEAMQRGKVDLAYFGPLSYMIARERCEASGHPITPFATQVRNGKPKYKSVIIANVNAPIETLADIKGKTIAFGDLESTSSHLIPRGMLAKIGLEIDRDYSANYTGSHINVVKAVNEGKALAGGLSMSVFDRLPNMKDVDSSQIKLVASSEYFPLSPWVMLDDLDDQLKEDIKAAFFNLDDEEALGAMKIEKLVPTEDANFDVIRQLIKDIDFDTSQS